MSLSCDPAAEVIGTRKRRKASSSLRSADILLISLVVFVNLVEAAHNNSDNLIKFEEEVELLRPSLPVAAATTTTTTTTSSQTTSKTKISGMKTAPAAHQQKHDRPHIYRIRAAQINGNLAAPIRVLPSHQFGARASSPGSQLANLQSQETSSASDREASGCTRAQQIHDNEQEATASSSISATSQVLRLSSNNATTPRSIVQRLGEIEDSPNIAALATTTTISRQEPASILLANQSTDQPITTTQSILNLIDEYDSKIITNKTRAQLSCDSGEMILRLNFSEPFRGIVYPDNNRLSPCRFFGDGHLNYELRLPLRGCGTKQAGQRVFVNDVIVRFHKTLELEEDEVKTLICRYPPPLTASPAQRPSGEQENAQNQFEFINEQDERQPAGRQKSANGGSELHDNLLPASPGGHQASNSYGGTVQELVPSTTSFDRQTATGNLFQHTYGSPRYKPNSGPRPSADLIDQRSSAPDVFSKQPQPIRTTGRLSGYFERLSSIELLFLISSLMFLVLLSLGLIGGYFCFRRKAANERRASAILRRKRRFVGSPAGILGASSGRQTPAGLLHPSMRHYYARHPPTTSSPESDLSGRGLLTAASKSLAPEEQSGYMFSNQAFVPDPMLPAPGGRSRELTGSGPVPPPKPVLGRRGDSMAIYGRQGTRHHHRVPSHQQLYSTNDPVNYGRHGQLHRVKQVYLADHNRMEDTGERRELSRARSLTCMPQPDEYGMDSVSDRRRWQQPIIGGTLSRHGQLKSSDQSHHQHQRFHRSHLHHRHNLPHHQHYHQRQRYLPALAANKMHLKSIPDNKSADASWLQVSSDSEIEPNNNQAKSKLKSESNSKGAKLFLKSIEDSYITKFTEVEEQEYMKRDSLRPFGLTEWRQKISEQQSASSSKQQRQPPEPESSYQSSSSSPSSPEVNELPALKTIATPDGEAEYRSNNANLRSLTELDVNFAKSLLRTSGGTPPPPLASANSEAEAKAEAEAEAQPEVSNAEDEDLVVSPEYDLSDRLEIRVVGAPADEGADESRNSVSYV